MTIRMIETDEHPAALSVVLPGLNPTVERIEPGDAIILARIVAAAAQVSIGRPDLLRIAGRWLAAGAAET